LTDFVHNFLLLLVDKRREAALPAIIAEYRNLANEARNIAEAEVITAMPLTDAEHKALAVKLSAVTGKNMVLKTQLDTSILGGVIVKIGDKLIDGSVARQLRMLKATLLTTEVTKIGVTN
jgi:F-type H+-transporting ATPase subunit delta